MPVYKEVDLRNVDFAEYDELYNGGERTTGNFNNDKIRLAWMAVKINDEPNLSSACKITKIKTYVEYNAYKGSAYSSMYVTFTGCPIAYNGYEFSTPFGTSLTTLGNKYCDSKDYGTNNKVYDVTSYNVSINAYPGFGFLIGCEPHGWTTIDRKAKARKIKIGYTRTRACYITFQGEGIDSTTTMYDYGSVPSRTVSRSGYSFIGWQHPNGTVYSGTLPTAYETDVTYTAVWEAQPYTVRFDINTNLFSEVKEQSVYIGDFLTLDTPTAKTVTITIDDGTTTRTEGFQATFFGWCDHRDDSLLDMNGIAFRGAWYANRYGDLFNAYGYDIQNLKTHFRYNGKGENRTFKDLNYPEDFPEDNPDEFYYFHKTNLISGLAEAGETAVLDAVYTASYTLPNAPTKSGYTFKGWNVDGDIRMPSSNISIAGNTTITAVFEPDTVTVNFHKADGSVDSRIVKFGSAISDIPTEARSGYEFGGWFAGDSFGESREYSGREGDYQDLGTDYPKYSDKFSVHIEARKDDWSTMGANMEQIISCAQGAGWNIGKNATNGAEAYVGGWKSATINFNLPSGWHSFDMWFDGIKIYASVDNGTINSVSASGVVTYGSGIHLLIGTEAGSASTIIQEANKFLFKGTISNLIYANVGTQLKALTTSDTITDDIDYYPIWRKNNKVNQIYAGDKLIGDSCIGVPLVKEIYIGITKVYG